VTKYKESKRLKSFMHRYGIMNVCKAFVIFKQVIAIRLERKKVINSFKLMKMKRSMKDMLGVLKYKVISSKRQSVNKEIAYVNLKRILLQKTLFAWHKFVEAKVNPKKGFMHSSHQVIRNHKLKLCLFKIWKDKVETVLSKVKAVRTLSQAIKKMLYAIWFSKYREEVDYLKGLEGRVILMRETIKTQVFIVLNIASTMCNSKLI